MQINFKRGKTQRKCNLQIAPNMHAGRNFAGNKACLFADAVYPGFYHAGKLPKVIAQQTFLILLDNTLASSKIVSELPK